MSKCCLDLEVAEATHLNDKYVLLKLTHSTSLPDMEPGQFVEVRVDNSPKTFLRRPISINFFDEEHNMLWLLIAVVGEGTRHLATLKAGDKVNCLFPLGNQFTMPTPSERVLLVGGGVGVAPLLFFGARMKASGVIPTFLLGARKASDLLQLDDFRALGPTYVTTEDGSLGEKGFVTNHSILYNQPDDKPFTRISCCGPKPMMKAVARYAKEHSVNCEVSLENMMACGLGACLCCVEKTVKGNLCVCKDGPVFNTKQLLWQD